MLVSTLRTKVKDDSLKSDSMRILPHTTPLGLLLQHWSARGRHTTAHLTEATQKQTQKKWSGVVVGPPPGFPWTSQKAESSTFLLLRFRRNSSSRQNVHLNALDVRAGSLKFCCLVAWFSISSVVIALLSTIEHVSSIKRWNRDICTAPLLQ
jgi:hypothetical protein